MASKSVVATATRAEEAPKQSSLLSSIPSETTQETMDEKKSRKKPLSTHERSPNSNGKIGRNGSQDGEIGSHSRSSFTDKRVLPNRPAHEIARDTKRILEICYGPKQDEGATSIAVDNELVSKVSLKNEGTDDSARKKTTKHGKKRRRRKSENGSTDDTVSESIRNRDAEVVREKVENIQGAARRSGTTKKKRRKKKTTTKTDETASIVTVDATGKVVRKRRKIKGRHRVVKQEFIKKGKDAKIELATISEGSDFEGEDIDDESEVENENQSYKPNMKCSDEEGESEKYEDSFDETIDTNSETGNIQDAENEGNEEQDITRLNDINRADGVLPVADQSLASSQTMDHASGASNNERGIVPRNENVVEQATDNGVVDATPATIDFDVEAGLADTQQSVASVDSTACTSTAEEENRRARKRVPFFGNFRNLVFAGLIFLLFVTALTVMVVYFVSPKGTNSENPILSPSSEPTSKSQPEDLTFSRPSQPPISAPTSAPTTIYGTSSVSCQQPERKSGVQIQEAEYAPEHFGNTTIGNENNGYCGEGYVTNLATSGSGFEFLPFSVNVTGYYRVAIRYNNADKTGKYLDLQINDLKEGIFDLIPTGNESTWMVQGVNDILLSEGKHVIRVSTESNNSNGLNIDWLSLSFQKSMSRFDYLIDVLDNDSNVTELSQSQSLALQWMSGEDTIDLSTLTNQEIIERLALVDVYYSTTGDTWSNNNQWLSEFHACSWYGVACSKDKLVTDLMLDNNGLVGRIPTSLSLLPNLILISLDTNSLEDEIPTQIGILDNLRNLYLHANFLTGPIPSEFGSLTNLEILDLRANYLNGQIPEELYSMVGLESFALSSNDLGGTLSTNIGKLISLLHLDLQNVQLTGPIPSELGNLILLSSLSLGYNEFSGSIPRELGLLSNLSILDLNSNRLTGIPPPELNLLEDTIIDYYGNDIVL